MTAQRELPIVDNYAGAWRDDGTEQGIIRTEQKRGALVQMPFMTGLVTLGVTGSATAILQGMPAPYLNTDNSGTYLIITVPASASLANSATAKFWITGNVFGLRFGRSSALPIGCMIDGRAYLLNTTNNVDPVNNSVGNLYGATDYELIADDLGPGRHFVELVFPSFVSGTTRVYNIFGYVVDGNAGYQKPTGQVVTVYQGTTAITATTGGTAQYPTIPNGVRGWRKAFVYNTTGSPVSIYCVHSLANTVVIWGKSVAAGDTVEFDPQGIVTDATNVRFYASGAGLNLTTIWAI